MRAARRPRWIAALIRSMHSRFSRHGEPLADHAGLERDDAVRPSGPRGEHVVGTGTRASSTSSAGHVSALRRDQRAGVARAPERGLRLIAARQRGEQHPVERIARTGGVDLD